MVSVFRRSASERLSLRYWYNGLSPSVITSKTNSNKDLIECIKEEKDEVAAPPTLVKRLYNSFLPSEWKFFNSSKQSSEIENEILVSLSNNAVATQTNTQLLPSKNKLVNNFLDTKFEPETPPPDPCPLLDENFEIKSNDCSITNIDNNNEKKETKTKVIENNV